MSPIRPPHTASSLIAALLLALLVASLPARPASADVSSNTPPRLATIDWTIAETLLGLGVTPLGIAQTGAYRDWVGAPELPATVADLGLRAQPNLELLADLAPERILISPMFASLESRLSQVAPVSTVALYAREGPLWPNLLAATREIAELANRPQAAERLIAASQARIAALADTLPPIERPLLMVQFMNARHVRIFGENSLYDAVLDRLGLANAWTGATNSWGFSLVGLEALAGIDARLVVVEPLPAGVEAALADSGLWRRLEPVRNDRVVTLPPVWSFGGLPSAQRFAEQLTAALRAAERDAEDDTP
ncbi:MAG: iron-siderophore ABC transporter substrate-binding protein [Pseudomonadota bacterium]|nr:iron-siderophore ABC transporter substrate-binding protein [Pseudomonadota bacterium]